MSGDTNDLQNGKASFDDIYDRPDPRAYVRGLSALEYQTPEHARRVFGVLVDAARRRADQPVAIADLACSYGINAALLNHDLTLEEFYDRYRTDEVADWSPERLADADREFYAARRRPDAVRTVGIDTAANAIAYALAVGVLDGGGSEDLEAHEPGPALRSELADVGLVTVTGGIGYITAATFDRLLGAVATGTVPWVAAFTLRWIDMRPIADALARHGLVLERFDGKTFRQRRFADETERDWVLGELERLGRDPDGAETDGYHHTELFLARTHAEADAVPLEKLLAPAL